MQVFYHPGPFRGNFVKVLLEDAGEPYTVAGLDELRKLEEREPRLGKVFAPPAIYDPQADLLLGQTNAVILYLATKFGYVPDSPVKAAQANRILMDCGDVLVELTRSNGSQMWTPEAWKSFLVRLGRFYSNWEDIAKRHGMTETAGYLFGPNISYADLAVFTVTDYFVGPNVFTESEGKPLSSTVKTAAPMVVSLWKRLRSKPQLERFLASQQKQYGNALCGGQIEASIRQMLASTEE